MAHDFLQAWLVEGDVVAAMGYVSERAYECLAQDAPDPAAFDRGVAPYELMLNLKAAHDALGRHDSLEDVTVGVRLTVPTVKVVTQKYHPQVVIYSVPDDVAATLDCQNQLVPGGSTRPRRVYGNFFGATFYIKGSQNHRVTLLWARENGYWKIVSWRTGVDEGDSPEPVATPDVKVVHVKADPSFVQAARGFLETWLLRKDYDAAFRYLSPKSYACYDLGRGPGDPASTSLDDAGRRVRAGIEIAGKSVGKPRNLEAILSGVEPHHAAIRIMDHADSGTFSLVSLPTALGDAIECDARRRGAVPPDPLPLEYGEVFAVSLGFRTNGEGAPVLRLLWRKEEGVWRITSYEVEVP